MPTKKDERNKYFSPYCSKPPESSPCGKSPEERLQAIEVARNRFTDIGIEIFTSSFRFGLVFILLEFGSACVCELQYALSQPSQPLISHHLREMKKAGWLKSEKIGRWMYYSLEESKINQMQSLFQSVFANRCTPTI